MSIYNNHIKSEELLETSKVPTIKDSHQNSLDSKRNLHKYANQQIQWRQRAKAELINTSRTNMAKRLTHIVNEVNNYHKLLGDFDITPSQVKRMFNDVDNAINSWQGVDITSCKKAKTSFKAYKTTATNWFNRNKAKIYGNYFFCPLIFKHILNYCRDIKDEVLTNNEKMDLFINIFLLIVDGKITFQRTKAQPLMPYQTLIQPNNFRKKCKEFVSFYDISWNQNAISPSKIHRKYQKDKSRSSKIFQSFISCLKSIQIKLTKKQYTMFKAENNMIASYNLHPALTSSNMLHSMSTMDVIDMTHTHDHVMHNNNIINIDRKKEPRTEVITKQNHINANEMIDYIKNENVGIGIGSDQIQSSHRHNYSDFKPKLNRLSLSRMDSGSTSTSLSGSENGSMSTTNTNNNNIRLVNNDEMSQSNSDTSSLLNVSPTLTQTQSPPISDNGLPESMNKLIEYVMSQDINTNYSTNNMSSMYQCNRTLSNPASQYYTNTNLNMNNNINMNMNMNMNNFMGPMNNVVFNSNQTRNHPSNHNGFINNISNGQISHFPSMPPQNCVNSNIANNNNNNGNSSLTVKYQLLYIDPSMPPIVISQNVV